jgi:hypothetical protein
VAVASDNLARITVVTNILEQQRKVEAAGLVVWKFGFGSNPHA